MQNALEDLRNLPIEIEGQIEWSSNSTFLVRLSNNLRAIYKPEKGERPLWDFPSPLYKREIAAFQLAQELRWPNIPETVERLDGPFGAGSLQLFIDADFSQHYLSLRETEHESGKFVEESQTIALFDLISNNADRKSGHVLLSKEGVVYAIDNALTFHVENKLRTVIWDFAGEPIADHLIEDLQRVSKNLSTVLADLLNASEIEALQERIRIVVEHPVYPPPSGDHPYPWPLI